MTPAQNRVIELARELIGKYDESGEFMDFVCPICGGDQQFDAVLVGQTSTGEDDLDETTVFCQCHAGKVEMLVEYRNLSIDDDLRQLELALVGLDMEEARNRVVPVRGWEGEFGDAHQKSLGGEVVAERWSKGGKGIIDMPELPVTMFAQPTLSPTAAKNIAAFLDPPTSDTLPQKRRRRKNK